MPLFGDEEVQRNLDRWYSGAMAILRTTMDEIGAILEGYAKSHHLWTPRTGATDVSTRGRIGEATENFITVYLSAGMDYDVFLELAREGKWSWLYPAVVANSDLIKHKLEQAVYIMTGGHAAPDIKTDIGVGEQ